MVIDSVFLTTVIVALTQYAKELGLAAKWARLVALVLGLGLGAAYQLSQGTPATFGEWFLVVIYGLALGITASGLYDFGRFIAKENAIKIEAAPIDDEAEIK